MKAYKNLSKFWTTLIIVTVASVSSFLYFSTFSISSANITNESELSIVSKSDEVSISRYLTNNYRFNDDKTLESEDFTKSTTELGSLQFNGVDSNIEISKLFTPRVNFSIGAWVKFDEFNKKQIIFSQGRSSSYDFELGINSDNTVYFDLRDSNDNIVSTTTAAIPTNTNAWNFIIATINYNINQDIDNTSTINLHVNDGTSKIVATRVFTGMSYSGITDTGATNFMIGSNIPSQNSDFLSATLDKAFIYDSALSQTQIENWTKKDSRLLPRIIPISGFAGLWEFESQSGTKTKDFSKYKRNGKLNNFTLSGWFSSPYKSDDLGSYGLQLDGINDYVLLDIPDDAKNQSNGTLNISFSINNFPSIGNEGVIFGISNENEPLSFIKIFIGNDKKLYYQVQNNGILEINEYYDVVLEENSWYHLILRKSGINTDFYLNGLNIAMSNSITKDFWIDDVVANKITLGSFKDSKKYSSFFSGNIQFIHSYPIALNQAQINHIFNNNQPTKAENIFTQYISSSFEVDFDTKGSKLYLGDFTKTFAKPKNVTARGPPDISNPIYYSSTSINFSNSTDYLLVPNQASLKDLDEFSVGIGFKYESSTLPTSNAYLFREETSGPTERVSVYLNSNGNLVCSIPDNGKAITMTSVNKYTDGDWHLVICSFDSISNNHKLSIDNDENIFLNKIVSNMSATSSDKIFIGSNSGIGNNFIGSIDDLFIVGESLSTNSIKKINYDRKSLIYTLDSPGDTYIGRWDFSESSGSFVDESPKNINIDTFTIDRISSNNNTGWSLIEETYNNIANIKSNRVLSFDGVDDYIEIVSTGSTKFDVNNEISISAWIKTEDQNSYIINRRSESGDDFSLKIKDGMASLSVYGSSGSMTIDSINTVNDGNWHNIVAQYSGTTASIYIDGSIASSSTVASVGTINSIDIPVEIGANTFESSYFSGSISELKMFETTLTEKQISNLFDYNSISEEGNIISAGIIFYMPINEGNNKFVYDNVFNGNDSQENEESYILNKSNIKGELKNFSKTAWTNPINSLYIQNSGLVINDKSINYSIAQDFTISTWIKPKGSTATSIYTLVEKSNSYDIDNINFEGIRIELIPQTSTDTYIVKAGFGAVGTNSYAISNPIIISSNYWTNLTATYQIGNGIQLFLNGVSISINLSQSPTGNFNLPDTPLLVGKTIRTGNPMFYVGNIANLTIYNKLLTQGELVEKIGKINEIDQTAILLIPFDEGRGSFVRDRINPSVFGKIEDDSSWSIDYAPQSKIGKKDHSRMLYIDYSDNGYVDFGPVITTNQNIAVEMVVAAKTDISSDVRLLDYGFGDSASSGAKFAIDLTNIGSLKVHISDGNISESTVETFETSPYQIAEGDFNNILFLYSNSTKQFDLYINDILILSDATSFTMNEANNQTMTMRIQGNDGFVIYRSLKLAADSSLYGIDMLNQSRIMDIPFTEGAGNTLYNKDRSIAGTIFNKFDWSLMNGLLDTYLSDTSLDISVNKMSIDQNGDIISDKYTNIEIPSNKDIGLSDQNFALEFWFSIDSQDGTYPLIEKGRSIVGDSSIDNSILIYLNDGIVNGWVLGQASTLSDTIENRVLKIGTKYHFVLQKDSTSNSLDLYYHNGTAWIKYWNTISSTKSLNNKAPLILGKSQSVFKNMSINNEFTGQFDEIRILNRAYMDQEYIDNDVVINVNDLSMSFPSSDILGTNNLISRFSFNDNKTDILIDSIINDPNTNGDINADLVKFFNNGLKFDGNSTGEVLYNNNINLNGSQFTLEGWVELDDLSRNQTILYKPIGTRANYQLEYNPTNGFVFTVGNSGEEFSVNSSTIGVQAGVPYYITLIYNKLDDKIKIYINGSLKDETILDAGFSVGTENSSLFIGEDDNNTNSNNFKGTIYQLRFWNTAIVFNSITQHMLNPFVYAGELEQEQLLSEWLFEEESGTTFKNSILSDLDGTIATSSSKIWGYKSQAGYFDGDNDYIEVDNSNGYYDFINGVDYTFEAWITYDPKNQTDEIGTIISNGDPINGEQGFLLGIQRDTNQIIFKTSNGTSSGSRVLTSKTLISDDKQYHILATYDAYGSNDIMLYIDSKLEDGTPAGSFSIKNNNDLLTLGATSDESNNIDHRLSGTIDEVRILDSYMDTSEVRAEYVGGGDSINSVPYSLIVTNNSATDLKGMLSIFDLLPPYLIINEDIEIFSSPKLSNLPTKNGDLISGYQYEFKYNDGDIVLKPGENIAINFYAKLDPTYEKISGENLSGLKIVYDIDPLIDSFASTIIVRNSTSVLDPFYSAFNGGNNIEQGKQGYIQVQYINDTTTTKYPLIIGYQQSSELMFNNSFSSNQIISPALHAPISLEPPTINSEIQDSGEYLRAYKKTSDYPSLKLEQLVPSNNDNNYFYSIPIDGSSESDTDNLRIQWNLKDDPSSIDGFRYRQYPINNIGTMNNCTDNSSSCIGSPQLANKMIFWSSTDSTNYSTRRWKRQDDIESYILSTGDGEFGSNYYFLYTNPYQGKNEFHIKVRDNLLRWGDTRKIDLWFDSYKPIATLELTGTNKKERDPLNQNDWWREKVTSTFTVKDDNTYVYDQDMNLVSGIDYIDFYFYNIIEETHDQNTWNRINDDSAGGGGIQARWDFSDNSTILTDQSTGNTDGTVQYIEPSNFWDISTPGAGHFGNSGENNYISFTGDVLDLTSDFSIETWVTFDDLTDAIIVSKWDDQNSKSYKLTIKSDGEIYLYTSVDGSTTIYSKSSGANITVGTEYFIAVSKEGVDARYYVNGVEKISQYDSAPNQHNSNKNVYIGREDKVDTTYLKGSINELRLFGRALTTDEISNHFAGGADGTLISEIDNNTAVGEISTEISIQLDGTYEIDLKAEDKATPVNAISSTYTIKIDQEKPTTSGIVYPYSNSTIGENGWFKSYGIEKEGIVGVSFEITEGIPTSSIYPGSGLDKMNFSYVVNGAGKDNFVIDWSSSTYLRDLLGFTGNSSSGQNTYTGTTVINSPITCINGSNYPLVINGITVDIWIGGCDANLTGAELSLMIRKAINDEMYDLSLDDYYDITYLSGSSLFTIESIGTRKNYDASLFTYNAGTYSITDSFTDYLLGFTEPGTHDIYFWGVDIAGNIEDNINHIQFKIDTAFPLCPKIGSSVGTFPNLWAFEPSENGTLGTYRDNELVKYVQGGYDSNSIDNEFMLDPNTSYDIQTPMFMWPKTDDIFSGFEIEGINYSGNIKYGYMWETANIDDFDNNGNIIATQPSNNTWSAYQSIGSFDINNSEDILAKHLGALMPYGNPSGSGDDIPEPPILNTDDGKSYFMWLRVKDEAGNENLCGQPGGEGMGPYYQFTYGKATRFTTQALYDNTIEKRVVISSDPANPTRFAAGPFIAGETIKFDQLYYRPSGTDITSGVILETGEGSYAPSEVVHLVNEDNKLSQNKQFASIGENLSVSPQYPSVKITQSMNPYREDMDWNSDYFQGGLSYMENGNNYANINDFFIGTNAIKTGGINGTLTDMERPPDLKLNHGIGRLQNFGLISGARDNSRNIQPGIVSVESEGQVDTNYNLENPLSTSGLINPKIVRGYTNVSGRYQVRIAILEPAEQFIEINFDILPAAPNFDCSKGECTKLKLNKP